MKRSCTIIVVLLMAAVILSAAGCGRTNDHSMAGIWEYSDQETGMAAVYDLKDDGTGTYTMTVGEEEVVYELKYEVKDGHFLVRYVNNEIFSEDDVFDNEFSFKDSDTMIIKDSFGEEMTFVRE